MGRIACLSWHQLCPCQPSLPPCHQTHLSPRSALPFQPDTDKIRLDLTLHHHCGAISVLDVWKLCGVECLNTAMEECVCTTHCLSPDSQHVRMSPVCCLTVAFQVALRIIQLLHHTVAAAFRQWVTSAKVVVMPAYCIE